MSLPHAAVARSCTASTSLARDRHQDTGRAGGGTRPARCGGRARRCRSGAGTPLGRGRFELDVPATVVDGAEAEQLNVERTGGRDVVGADGRENAGGSWRCPFLRGRGLSSVSPPAAGESRASPTPARGASPFSSRRICSARAVAGACHRPLACSAAVATAKHRASARRDRRCGTADAGERDR